MPVDYDLVVLGGTQEGYDAARHAAQLGARVALVLQGLDGRRSPLQTLGALWSTRLPMPSNTQPDAALATWQWAIQRAELIAATLVSDEPQQLMVQGVDVIAEHGQLVGDRPLQVVTATRQLTTRAVLLATGSVPKIPSISGLSWIPYETPETVLQLETLPQSVTVLGSAPLGLALCQLLCRWNIPVTLITPNAILLNREDPDISRWITAQLQAEGVQLHLGATVEAIATNDATTYSLQLSGETVTAKTVVVAAGYRPNLVGTDLEKFVKCDRPLTVNAYLQTQHPRIYACGSVLGGYGMPAITRQEALFAVENALFWNRRRIDYCTLPYDLPTQPEMARVGLTEPQARQRYGEADLLMHRQSLYENPKAQWLESTIGFCKLIAHRNGQILGVHGVGPEASEWVQMMALLMAQKVSWHAVADHPLLPHSLGDIVRQAMQQWQRDRWQPGQWRRDWAENWFNWRRSR
ncbi:MAG: NAD(P)/FAD-dependent oxidoreductase [Cyanobacteria bacterium J06626_18]